MTNYIHSLKAAKLMKSDGSKVAAIMQVFAWITLIGGLFVCLFNLSHFSDSNLGLMVGIGMMIAGMQIYGIGTFVNLLHTKTEKE